MSGDPLRELAAAATQRGTKTLGYQTPPAASDPTPAPGKGLFRVGFFFGLGFFTAALVFWTVIFIGSIVLGGLLASACSSSRSTAPPPPWTFPR